MHPTNAMFATAFHRTVIFECDAEVSEDAEVLAAQQQRLMAHYQPAAAQAGRDRARDVSRAVQEIAALTLHVRARKVKWKLAQNRSRDARKLIASCANAAGPPMPARRTPCSGRWITKPTHAAVKDAS